ncbi:hypothetical protein ECANGB1_1181 [Enterospora canceri]|uniref:Uncharacterized protein n=1 Tax=Enterospora canceri TaxID=1081671 RepID=A0A1Y1S6P3_9MICR|nr:hypothetical protein ECANGB1_1181 [Enterospora canceri]
MLCAKNSSIHLFIVFAATILEEKYQNDLSTFYNIKRTCFNWLVLEDTKIGDSTMRKLEVHWSKKGSKNESSYNVHAMIRKSIIVFSRTLEYVIQKNSDQIAFKEVAAFLTNKNTGDFNRLKKAALQRIQKQKGDLTDVMPGYLWYQIYNYIKNADLNICCTTIQAIRDEILRMARDQPSYWDTRDILMEVCKSGIDDGFQAYFTFRNDTGDYKTRILEFCCRNDTVIITDETIEEIIKPIFKIGGGLFIKTSQISSNKTDDKVDDETAKKSDEKSNVVAGAILFIIIMAMLIGGACAIYYLLIGCIKVHEMDETDEI